MVQVSDNGSGIEPDFLPHVFDRFRQADAGAARRHGGLGIGLSLVRQLVELHGGDVEAHSEGPGRGARFTVRLPIGAMPRRPDSGLAPLDDAPPTAPRVFTPVGLHGLRVLVVDDDSDARELLEQMLQACGARVVLAAGAEEALQRLAVCAPDVLVSDIGMPAVDGYELVRRVRALGSPVAEMPALALTAFAGTQDEARALQAGFDAFLPKPVDGTALVERIAVLAAARRAA
jgi:CheY-like chemotaxis protein